MATADYDTRNDCYAAILPNLPSFLFRLNFSSRTRRRCRRSGGLFMPLFVTVDSVRALEAFQRTTLRYARERARRASTCSTRSHGGSQEVRRGVTMNTFRS